MDVNCIWDENGSNLVNFRGNSSVLLKEKELILNNFKSESGNNYDKVNCDVGGYVFCGVGLNWKWLSYGFDGLI